MKLTAEITHDQLQALVARSIKVEPSALTLATDEQGRVTGHVTTDSKTLRKIEARIAKATAHAPEAAQEGGVG